MIKEFRNKFNIGDIVKSEKYKIECGQIISVETHVDFYLGGKYDIGMFDYDILCENEDSAWIEHISENHIEKI